MTDKQRLAKLVKAEQLLKRTKDGYPGPGKGTYWKPALALIHEGMSVAQWFDLPRNQIAPPARPR